MLSLKFTATIFFGKTKGFKMPTWFVTYKFKNSAGQWVVSNVYTVAATSDEAKKNVGKTFKESKLEFVILDVRVVGEGK